MSNTELIFERPMLLFLFIPAILLIVAPFFIFTRRRKTIGKVISLILRTLACSALILALAGIGLKTTTTEQSVALLMDYSDSTLGVRQQIKKDALLYQKLIDENTPVSTYAFASGQLYEVRQTEDGTDFETVEVEGGSTNIGQALEFAASSLPDDHAKRVILLSDGKETDGSAQISARILRTSGVRVDAVCYDTEKLSDDEMQISAFTGPETVEKGETVRLSVTLDSFTEGQATLLLSENGSALVDGAAVKRIQVDVAEGRNVYELETLPTTVGNHIYKIEVQTEYDTIAENNARYCTVTVSGNGKILIIAGNVGDAYYLQRLLKERVEVDKVDLKSVYTAPTTIYELCKYDQIILVNAGALDLPEGYDKLLDEFVSVYGKSLLTFGGNATYSLGGMQKTGYEKLLPMEFKFEREQTDETVALMLVLDCSRSMEIYNANVFFYAKDSAVKCLGAVSEADYIGVVCFNTNARIVHPLVAATDANKAKIEEAIYDIETGPGTHYTPALDLAYNQLINSKASIKHVIFLSDGEPIGDNAYEDAARRLAGAGITISTIGIVVQGRLKSEPMKRVAAIGNGLYYEVSDESSLPDILLTEAMSVAAGPLVLEDSYVTIPHPLAETKGMTAEQFPVVKGYIGTTPKEDAEVVMLVGRGDPLLLRWNYGKGTVSSFLSDCAVTWTGDWKNNDVCSLLFERMCTTIFTQTNVDSALIPEVRQEGQTLHVTIETALKGRTAPEIKIKGGKKDVMMRMTPAGKNLYTVDITAEKTGMYEFTVTVYDYSNNVMDQNIFTYPVSYSEEYDAFAVGGRATLSDITYLAGGRTLDAGGDIEALAGIELGKVYFKRFFTLSLVVLAFILFLLDVAVCMLKMRDIKARFRKIAAFFSRKFSRRKKRA